jgi:ATP-dependent helicase HrpB
MTASLPIEAALPELLAALGSKPNAVLEAPPGAGKTTWVPLALLDQPWTKGGKILVLEPRRIAARAAAHRMAQMRGEDVGGIVGYRVRLDSRVGPRTRIEVVTDGLFARRIQNDPSLDGVAALLFDEFHERGLESDLGLALALEAQKALRPDLRILVMSATLDGVAVAKLLGGGAIVRSPGRAFPVAIEWQDRPGDRAMLDTLARTVRRALAQAPGDALVFLPGVSEIRRTAERLDGLGPEIDVMPLYGDLSAEQQDRAIRPSAPGRRKVVLATSIAETSLTIEGTTIVVDSGLKRAPRFDPRTGMSKLETLRVSQASAEQRAGRAGRTAPGMCFRLWSEAEHRQLARYDRPEIAVADLAPLALELAAWGNAAPEALALLDPPPAAAYAQARALLAELGAFDAAGRITAHGRAMAELAAHPRLAHMMSAAKEIGIGAVAADIAALIEEHDVIKSSREADLRSRLELLRRDASGIGGAAVDKGALMRAREAAKVWRRRLRVEHDGEGLARAGEALALAYPERVAKRRGGAGRSFLLASGRGAVFFESEPLSAEDYIAIGDLDAGERDARIFSALPLSRGGIEELFASRIAEERIVTWDPRAEAVVAVKRRRLGALVLEEKPAADLAPGETAEAMLAGVRAMGLACLPWSKAAIQLRARIAFLRRELGGAWPDLSDDALLAGLAARLGPFLDGRTRRAHLADLDLHEILMALLDWPMREALARDAPTHLDVPSGSRIAVDYGQGDIPVLAVRLQEMFGCADTPTLAGGKVKALLHLLSPARRPVQVTRDLAGFWRGTYKDVKRDLKGQYPKHSWPDYPLLAPPTARAKPRGT